MNEIILAERKAHLHEKNIWHHLSAVASSWKYSITVFVGCFSALWTAIEAYSYALSLDLHDGRVIGSVTMISGLLALVFTIRRYLSYVPDGYHNESRTSQQIAHLQRPYWELKLCRQLLDDKLLILDNIHTDLLEGRSYVSVERRYNIQEYLEWSRVRSQSIIRMIDVAKTLLADLINVTCTTAEYSADPRNILNAVDRIAQLYQETIMCEKQYLEIYPPERLSTLHDLQKGWTEPVRAGIRDYYKVIDAILATQDAKVEHSETPRVEFTVVFPEPVGIAEYLSELAQLDETQ